MLESLFANGKEKDAENTMNRPRENGNKKNIDTLHQHEKLDTHRTH